MSRSEVMEDQFEAAAWVAFAAAVLGGIYASDAGPNKVPTEVAAARADEMLEEYRARRPR
jgi:hypothetical protein